MLRMDLNAFVDLSDEGRQHLIDWLDPFHKEMIDEGNVKEELVMGLEQLLQALGAEGYEFT